MTPSHREAAKRLGVAALAAGLLLTPALSRADASSTTLATATAATPMRSLISSPILGPAIGQLSYGALFGLDIPPSGYNVGPRLSGEMMYGFVDLAPQLRLDLGARASFAYHGIDTGFSGISASFWLLDVVPDARLRFALTDVLGVYGDAGLGLAYEHASASAFGSSGSSNDIDLTVQFGAGVAYAIAPNINLLGEVRFSIYTRNGTGTFITLPAVGLEFH